MKRMTRGLPLCAAVLAMMTACGGNGSDGKEGMPMRQKIEQVDRQLTVGMTENPDSMLGVVDSLQMSGWLPLPLADYERGTCYALMEKRRIGEYYYTKALEGERLMELWPRAYYRASVNLAILLSGKGDEESALKVATRAYDRLQESAQDPDAAQWKAALLFNIGSSQLNLGYTAEGRETLRAAMTHVRRLATEDPTSENLRTWATLAVNTATVMANNHQDDQLTAIREAEDAVKAMGQSREVPPALTDMLRGKVASLKAMYYVEQGQMAEAATAYRQYLATDYANMPQTYTERLTFLEKSGRWEEAARLLPDIWQVHEEMGMRPDITYMSDLAEGYVVYRKTGNRDSALSVGDRMAAMVDSVRRYNQEDAAAELAVIYDTQQKEAEIYRQRWQMRRQQGAAVAVILTLLLIAVGIYALMRRRTTRLLRRKNEELTHKNKELARLYQTKQNFLNNISHEMRTPLNAIVGFSQVLLTPGLELTDEEYDDMEKRIRESSKLLTDIVDKMIELSYYDTMSEVERIDTVELKTLCREVMYGYLSSVKPDVKLRVTDDGGAVYTVVTNRDILQRVLRHLMDNAVKFTEKGEIVMGIYLLKTGGITISVTDTGCGIPESRRKEVFELFSETGEQVRTTGLGLSICRTLVRLLGGTIRLDDSYHAGTRIVITIQDS